MRRFGVTPKAALLSHSNFGTHNTASAVKMRQALQIVRSRLPELEVDGEMHADAALSESIRARTYPDCHLTGAANLLIMPTLDAANISFNMIKTLDEAVSIGPILIGLHPAGPHPDAVGHRARHRQTWRRWPASTPRSTPRSPPSSPTRFRRPAAAPAQATSPAKRARFEPIRPSSTANADLRPDDPQRPPPRPLTAEEEEACAASPDAATTENPYGVDDDTVREIEALLDEGAARPGGEGGHRHALGRPGGGGGRTSWRCCHPEDRTTVVGIIRPSLRIDAEVLLHAQRGRARAGDEAAQRRGDRPGRFAELDSDDALELIEGLDDDERVEILSHLPVADRLLVEEGLTFPEYSAGRLMQREFRRGADVLDGRQDHRLAPRGPGSCRRLLPDLHGRSALPRRRRGVP